MMNRKRRLVAAAAAIAVVLGGGAAYGAYAMGGSDAATRGHAAPRRGADQAASLQLRCGTPTPAAKCVETATEQPELTCEEAGACPTATIEPELTCEEANACATPETECSGDVCFSPPLPPIASCPSNAACSAAAGFYYCVRGSDRIRCSQPVPMPIPPCPMPPPAVEGNAPSVAPACPPFCGGPVPMPGGGAQPRSVPACPPPCLDMPAPAPPTGTEPQTFAPPCPPPCGAPVPTPAGDAQTQSAPGCPEPLVPDCVMSSDGACPGATPIAGAGSGTAIAATAVPGVVEPMPPDYSPD